MNNIVWSVNIMLGIGMIGVGWVIYKILWMANQELKDSSNEKH
jgi:hypothetical protein